MLPHVQKAVCGGEIATITRGYYLREIYTDRGGVARSGRPAVLLGAASQFIRRSVIIVAPLPNCPERDPASSRHSRDPGDFWRWATCRSICVNLNRFEFGRFSERINPRLYYLGQLGRRLERFPSMWRRWLGPFRSRFRTGSLPLFTYLYTLQLVQIYKYHLQLLPEYKNN